MLSTNRDAIGDNLTDAIKFDIGIDEVGRGPLYGNVVVGGVILPSAWSHDVSDKTDNLLVETPLATLTDSKKISEKKRNILKPKIEAHALGYVTVDVPAHIIDDLNIYQATLLGMKMASEALIVAMLNAMAKYQQSSTYDASLDIAFLDIAFLDIEFDLLIDGNALPKFEWHSLLHRYGKEDCKLIKPLQFNASQSIRAEAWIKGDARHTAIAAASVIAKVRRDNQLIAASRQYPKYGFEKHKGYPTKAHIQALLQYGALPEHRRSFKPVQKVLIDD